MSPNKEELAASEVGRLIAADKVQGTEVYGRGGESLGKIENVMIDKPSGKVAYAVMSFGGILGMGKDRHALPWGVLTYDPSLGGYVMNIDRERLEGAPAYSDSPDFNWEDNDWGRRLHEYYDVPPTWR